MMNNLLSISNYSSGKNLPFGEEQNHLINLQKEIRQLEDKNLQENLLKAWELLPVSQETAPLIEILMNLFKKKCNEEQQSACLQILSDIPREERFNVIEKSQNLLKDNLSYKRLYLTFLILGRMAPSNRKLEIVEIMVDLFENTFFTKHFKKWNQIEDVINLALKIPLNKRSTSIQKIKDFTHRVTDFETRARLLIQILKFLLTDENVDDFLNYLIVPPSEMDVISLLIHPDNTLLSKICYKYTVDHKNAHIISTLFDRISERHFYLLRSLKPKDLPLIKEMVHLIEFACSYENKKRLASVLSDLKLNHALALTQENLKLMLDTLEKIEKDKTSTLYFRLAIQTHPDLREIVVIFEKEISFSLIECSHSFSNLSLEEKEQYLLLGVILRRRNDLIHANHIIKQAIKNPLSVSEKLLDFSLRLCSVIGAYASKNSVDQLLKILNNTKHSTHIRVQAAHTLSQVEEYPKKLSIYPNKLKNWNFDKEAAENFLSGASDHCLRQGASEDKNFNAEPTMSETNSSTCLGITSQLVGILKKTEQLDLQIALIKTIGLAQFEREDDFEDILKTLIHLTTHKNSALNREITLTLSIFPNLEALEMAADLVKSAWDDNDDLFKPLCSTLKTGYHFLNYRPEFLDSRTHMMRLIGERYVALHRKKWEIKANEALICFEKSPHLFSQQMQNLKKLIMHSSDAINYIPFPLFLPEKKVIFRGLHNKKEEKLGKAVLTDLLIKGTGSADLSLYEDPTTTIWAKIGHVFAGIGMDYVLNRHFDKDGILLLIHSDLLNEMQLRRMVRWEMGDCFNSVFYTSLKPYMLTRVFIAQEKKEEIENLIQFQQLEKTQNATIKLQKIAKRHLIGSPNQEKQHPLGLMNKISWFDPDKNLKKQINSSLLLHNLETTTKEEIWKENFIRQWIREELLKKFTGSSSMGACLLAAATAMNKIHDFN